MRIEALERAVERLGARGVVAKTRSFQPGPVRPGVSSAAGARGRDDEYVVREPRAVGEENLAAVEQDPVDQLLVEADAVLSSAPPERTRSSRRAPPKGTKSRPG